MSKGIDNVISNCEICIKYRKAPPKPIVGFSKASDFNDTISIDLHQLLPNVWYMHIIDEFSRLSNAAIIKSKTETVKMLLMKWISIFGAPNTIFSDNGGEFISDKFYDMCEAFNIKVLTTPSRSPWSNGLCERHNQTLTNMYLKIKEDVNCDMETALAWAVNAKNAVINNNGFSLSQTAYGKNPNLQSNVNNNLPAFEDHNTTEKLVKHINALHSGRKAFIQSESSEKIKRPFRNNIRPSGKQYSTNEEVYYKREDSQKWIGPAKVSLSELCKL